MTLRRVHARFTVMRIAIKARLTLVQNILWSKEFFSDVLLTNFLGGAAEVRYLDGDQINIAQESDLKFALKDVKTVIVAADAYQSGKTKGFFDKGTNSSCYYILKTILLFKDLLLISIRQHR